MTSINYIQINKMPFSVMIPLTKIFINKPLNNRMGIVIKVWNARLASHAGVFTLGKGVPLVMTVSADPQVIDTIINTI